MKKVFRSHPALTTLGRFFLVFTVCAGIAMTALSFYAYLHYKDGRFLVSGIIILVLLGVFCVIGLPQMWKKCFETLVVTDDSVTWKCAFAKSHSIPTSEIKYSKTAFYKAENDPRADIYKTGKRCIVVSPEPIPQLKASKYKCSDALIAFPSRPGLCRCLCEALGDAPCGGIFKAMANKEDRLDKEAKRAAKHSR